VPVSAAGNRQLLFGARNYDTLSWQMMPTEKKQKMNSNLTEIR